MEELDLGRQSKIVPEEFIKEKTVEIYGIGSVGGFIALLLAKVGFKSIKVLDMDTVDPENIGPQVYTFKHMGMKKVDAMKEIIKDASGIDIEAVDMKFTEESELTPEPNTIYVCGFDTHECRKMLFDKLKDYPVIFLDNRIGKFDKRSYLIDGRKKEDISLFARSLEVKADAGFGCGEKASAYINFSIASGAVGNLLNFLCGRDCYKIYVGNMLNPQEDIYIPMKDEPVDETTGEV